jgi:uncharacterized protein (TIRG00374 family)
MRSLIRSLVIVVCTVGLLALFLRQVDLREVLRGIGRAEPLELVLALAATAANYLIRAARWQVMLRPVGRARFSTAFRTTIIGFAANSLLPGRVGEFLRPLLLARREGLRATSCFATIILERLLDLVTALALFGTVVFLSGSSLRPSSAALFATIKYGGGIAAVASAAALAFIFVMAGHPERLGRLVRGSERLLPARLAHALAHFLEMFAGGLAVMRRPGALVASLALSLPLWLSIAAGIWMVSRAFHIEMPFTGTFLLIALLTVGVAVPTPGAVGSFHYAYKLGATVFFGADAERAVGAAIVLHAISFVPVALVGLAFMVQDGIDLTRVRSMGESAAADAEGDAVQPAGTAPEEEGHRA